MISTLTPNPDKKFHRIMRKLFRFLWAILVAGLILAVFPFRVLADAFVLLFMFAIYTAWAGVVGLATFAGCMAQAAGAFDKENRMIWHVFVVTSSVAALVVGLLMLSSTRGKQDSLFSYALFPCIIDAGLVLFMVLFPLGVLFRRKKKKQDFITPQ